MESHVRWAPAWTSAHLSFNPSVMRSAYFLLVASLCFALGCGSTDDSCSIGAAQCECTAGGGCDPGLVCVGGMCESGRQDGGDSNDGGAPPPDAGRDASALDGSTDAGVDADAGVRPLQGHLGVPDPAVRFGYDPGSIEKPERPPSWPSTEAPGFYYIDRDSPACTDSGNPLGTPDRPRCTPEAKEYAPGDYLEIHGEGYTFSGGNQWRPVFPGTAEQPIWVVGDAAEPPVMDGKWTLLNSSHLIVEHIEFRTNGVAIDLREGNSFISLRHLVARGDGVTSTGGSVFALSGAETNWNEHLFLSDLDVTDVGDRSPDVEDDVLGVTAGVYVEWVWVLDSYIARMGADSIRVGQNRARTGGDVTSRARMVFVSGNHFEQNGENSVDIKFCEDAVISQNVMHDAGGAISDPGAVVVSHEHAERVWILFNQIYDGFIGVAATDSVTDHMVVGNVIHSITAGGGDSGRGFALNMRGGSTGVFVHNSVYGTVGGVQIENGMASIANNAFAGLDSPGRHLVFGDTSTAMSASAESNLFDVFRAAVGSTEISEISELGTTVNGDVGSIGDARFVAPPQNLATQSGSPAHDAAADLNDLFARYESLYGASIRFGFDGTERPTGAGADIGAHER